MRIGIDFDNTIVNYGPVFFRLGGSVGLQFATESPTKDEVKEQIFADHSRNPVEAENLWRHFQTLAYGPYSNEARLFPDVADCIRHLVSNGHEVFIVSHKTTTAAADPSVHLRDFAWCWMQEQRFFEPLNVGGLGLTRESVFFESTLNDKIGKIRALACDAFVDDLPAVVGHEQLRNHTLTLLFAPSGHSAVRRFSCWRKIKEFLKGLDDLGASELMALCESLPSPIIALERQEREGNNRTYFASALDGQKYFIKQWDRSSASQLHRATNELAGNQKIASITTQAGLSQNVVQVPKPLAWNLESGIIVYEFAAGNTLSANEVRPDHITRLADFLVCLQNASKQPKLATIGEGGHSRTCLQDYEKQIERRLTTILDSNWVSSSREKLREISTEKLRPQAVKLIEEDFIPLFEAARLRFRERMAQRGLDPARKLSQAERILSPSDFGFHNLLVTESKITLVDLEHFGWDDPAKLLADFYHHVSHQVSASHVRELIAQFTAQAPGGRQIAERFSLIFDLIGMEWILIVLNVFAPENLARRQFSAVTQNSDDILAGRLTIAKTMLARYRHNHEGGLNYFTRREDDQGILGNECFDYEQRSISAALQVHPQ